MVIKLFLTGGTFDKAYDELTARLNFDKSHIYEMLQVSRTTREINVEQLLLKDSLDITEDERQMIAEACVRAEEDHIVITHGTDTMAETAMVIKQTGLTGKTVVLTGAMVPYSVGRKSDAMFNLGSALAFAQLLPPGVYVAMNGRYFEAGNVRKDRKVGIFTEA